MASALTAFALGFYAHRKYGGAEIELHKQTWVEVFACLAYVGIIFTFFKIQFYTAEAIAHVTIYTIAVKSPSYAGCPSLPYVSQVLSG